mmetsp:Transcript_85200/g.264731  ORF Transcript_85200/g.264731 Transcript_85200/m.264731 type:complete len:433 (-) Transcript_85200:2614-3912(-)
MFAQLRISGSWCSKKRVGLKCRLASLVQIDLLRRSEIAQLRKQGCSLRIRHEGIAKALRIVRHLRRWTPAPHTEAPLAQALAPFTAAGNGRHGHGLPIKIGKGQRGKLVVPGRLLRCWARQDAPPVLSWRLWSWGGSESFTRQELRAQIAELGDQLHDDLFDACVDLDRLQLRIVLGCDVHFGDADHGRQRLHELWLKLHALEDGAEWPLQVRLLRRHLIGHAAREPDERLDDVGRGHVGVRHLLEDASEEDPRRCQAGALPEGPQGVRGACPAPEAELHVPREHRDDGALLGGGRAALQHGEEVRGVEGLQQALVNLQDHVHVRRHRRTFSTLLGRLRGLSGLRCGGGFQGRQNADRLVAGERLPDLGKHSLREAGSGGRRRRRLRRFSFGRLLPLGGRWLSSRILRALAGACRASGRCQAMLEVQRHSHD